MMLSCYCDSDGDYDWYYDWPNDYSQLDTKQRRRCKSCGAMIEIGATCIKWRRSRYANGDYEINRFGDGYGAIKLASWYWCESCADQYFNLVELGYCVNPEQNAMELLAEYVRMANNQSGGIPPSSGAEGERGV